MADLTPRRAPAADVDAFARSCDRPMNASAQALSEKRRWKVAAVFDHYVQSF